MIGERVGNYVIDGELGVGGMGVVYRARHAVLGRPAAVKVLLPQFSATPEIVQRFFNEAKAATSIRHLGIVEIYDFGLMDSGVAFIAMELLRGQALGARLRERRVRPAEALATIRQMCGALGAAHELGIVHRDLKPDNVFLVPDAEVAGGERIKLLDFGIAKLSQDGGAGGGGGVGGMASHTRTGSLMGTPAYMAPEQCRGVRVDHRADLYSLGCMLYEMVSGHPPFRGEGVGDVLAAHIHAPPEPLDRAAPGAPASIARLVDRLLAKDPAARPQSAAALIAEIDRIAAGVAHAPLASLAASALAAGTVAPTLPLDAPTPPPGLHVAEPPSPAAGHAPPRAAAAREPRVSASPAATAPGAPARRTGRMAVGIGVAAVAVAVAAVAVAVIASGTSGSATSTTRPSIIDAAPAVASRADRAITAADGAPASAPSASADAAIAAPTDATMSALAATAPTVAIDIDSVPTAASLSIDGVDLGVTPVHAALPRSDAPAQLVLQHAGFAPRRLAITPSQPVRAVYKLTALAAAPPPSPHVPASAPRPPLAPDDDTTTLAPTHHHPRAN